MRLPRFRLKLWWLMIAVAVFSVLLALAPVAARTPQHWRLAHEMVRHHNDREAVCLKVAAEAPSLAPKCRRQAEYHSRMGHHWGWVAYQPWRSLQAELRADVVQQPPDAIWTVIKYGLADEVDY